MAEDFTKDDLLGRWLGGTLSEAEERELRARPDFAEYEALVRQVDDLARPPFNPQAALARQKALRKPQNKDVATTDLGADAGARKGKTATIRRLSRFRWAGAAATVLLLLSLVWWSLRDGRDYFAAPPGAATTANLSDGSSARLNAGSDLAFDDGDTSRVATLRGEAFFDVQPDGRPFTVKTIVGEVTVLGTSFNVYSRASALRVSCKTGRVRVDFLDREDSFNLSPGQSVNLEASGTLTETSAGADEAFDWLSNQSIFRERPLSEVLAELERQFNLQIEVPTILDLQQRVTTTFPNDAVVAALDIALSPIENITYTQNNKTVVIRMK